MAQWKEITTVEEWEQALRRSEEQPVLVIKHSTRCPVSAEAWEEYREFVSGKAPEEAEYIMVKVIESREVSNRIAEDLEVQHKSPQAILFRNRKPVWHTSHWHIKTAALEEAFQAH
ncbi:bacillithiol system protein YtxJ [Melghirimyces profundicolus]|uniref:Bacillithiol system protein YtxJ n=1 Tax=Melghirimyces profundicolus TaxID=1242148 RepID=A0A2T6BGI5_9BACL|nr:bacillithiol system redox-active protein YtxJ [Melghirimyces profundicolus]PTX55172.1 bacillithiol system protein YtxJ [Melghirimyces profundicolus]